MPKSKTTKPTNAQWTFANHYVRDRKPIKALEAAYPQTVKLSFGRKRKRAQQTMGMVGTKVAIKELENDVKVRAKMDLGEHLDSLLELKEKAIEDRDWGNAIKAEVKRGEACGFYVKRNENVNVNVTSMDELSARFTALMEQNPQLAKKIKLPGMLQQLTVGEQSESVIENSDSSENGMVGEPETN